MSATSEVGQRIATTDALAALEATMTHTRNALALSLEQRSTVESLTDEREEQLLDALAHLKLAHDALDLASTVPFGTRAAGDGDEDIPF